MAARRNVRRTGLPLAAFALAAGTAIAPYLAHVRAETGAFALTKKKPAAHLLNVYRGEQGDAGEAEGKSDLPRTSSAAGAAVEVGKRLAFDLFYLPALLALAALARPRRREAWAADLYPLLPAALWIGVCFLLARSHGYVSHRHLSPAALLLLGFAGRGAFAAGAALASRWKAGAARWGESRVAAGAAAALALLAAGSGAYASFKPYRADKAYLVDVGRDLRASEGPGRAFVGNSIRIAFYAEGRHADVPPFAGFEEVRRFVLDRGADLFVVDVLDPHFPVRHAELVEPFRDFDRPPKGFAPARRWTVGESSGRARDVRAFRVDEDALRASLGGG